MQTSTQLLGKIPKPFPLHFFSFTCWLRVCAIQNTLRAFEHSKKGSIDCSNMVASVQTCAEAAIQPSNAATMSRWSDCCPEATFPLPADSGQP